MGLFNWSFLIERRCQCDWLCGPGCTPPFTAMTAVKCCDAELDQEKKKLIDGGRTHVLHLFIN